jgi:hypothetical protein
MTSGGSPTERLTAFSDALFAAIPLTWPNVWLATS